MLVLQAYSSLVLVNRLTTLGSGISPALCADWLIESLHETHWSLLFYCSWETAVQCHDARHISQLELSGMGIFKDLDSSNKPFIWHMIWLQQIHIHQLCYSVIVQTLIYNKGLVDFFLWDIKTDLSNRSSWGEVELTHLLFTTMALITSTCKQPRACGGQTTSRVILHTLCHDRSIFKCDRIRTRHAGTACSSRPECQKTDCCLPITSRNSGHTVDELPSPPCSSSTLISAGLFTKMGRKKQRGWKDRNPFVSLVLWLFAWRWRPWVFCSVSDNSACVCSSPGSLRRAETGREAEEKGRSSEQGLHIVRTTRIRFCYCGDWIAFQYQGI